MPQHIKESNRISKGSHIRKGGVAGINQWMTFLSFPSLGAYKVSTVHRSYTSACCHKARHRVCYPFSLCNSLKRLGNQTQLPIREEMQPSFACCCQLQNQTSHGRSGKDKHPNGKRRRRGSGRELKSFKGSIGDAGKGRWPPHAGETHSRKSKFNISPGQNTTVCN